MAFSNETITFLGDIATGISQMFASRQTDIELWYDEPDAEEHVDSDPDFDRGAEIIRTTLLTKNDGYSPDFDADKWIDFVEDHTLHGDLQKVLYWMYQTDNSPDEAIDYCYLEMTPEEIEIALERLDEELE